MPSSIASEYDKTQVAPHAYGFQPVHAWGIRHRDEVVGTHNRRIKKQALGVGPWGGVDKLWADAFPIDAPDWVFHPGNLVDDTPDAIWPDEPPHPLFAHLSVKTPVGIGEDSADKLFGIYRCLLTPDFDEDGNQVDEGGAVVPLGPELWPDNTPNPARLNPDAFFFKPNPFNVVTNEILRFGGQPRDLINYPAGVEWRDWNDIQIPWDDTKYTPRSLSLTPIGGGGPFGGLMEVRVTTLRGGDESSASRHTPNQATSRVVVAGGSAVQVAWLIKGDEEQPAVPPGDIDGYRIYYRNNGGAWHYITHMVPGARSYILNALGAGPEGDPPDMASAGLMRLVPRFQCMPFFMPPYGLAAAVQRICQIACADYQWSGWGTGTYRNDKLRFMSPETRNPVFELNLAQVAPGTFKAYPVSKQNRFNRIVVNFRDLDDPFLGPADPVVLDRENLQGEGINAFVLDIGTAYRSQAQRTAAFYARFIIDLAWQCEVTASPKTYILLPGNVMNVTHDTPNWNDQQFIIQKKSERIEGGIGDPLIGHLYTPGIYSDNDWSPLPNPLPAGRANVFAQPPHVTGLGLQVLGGYSPDGSWQARIRVSYQHAHFGLQQRAIIEYRHEDEAEYTLWGIAAPLDIAGHGSVDISGLPQGVHWVRVRSATTFAEADPLTAPETSVEVVEIPPAAAPVGGVSVRDSNDTWRNTWNPGTQAGGVVGVGEGMRRYLHRLRLGGFDGDIIRETPVDTAPSDIAEWTQHLFGFPCSQVATTSEEGRIYHPGSVTEVGCVWRSQPIRSDSRIRMQLSNKLPPRVISLIDTDGTATGVFWDTTFDGGIPRLVPQFQTAKGRRPLPLEIYAIEIRQRQATYLGPGGIVMFQSGELPITDEYRLQVQFGLLDGMPQELLRVTIEPTEPEIFLYTAQMQREDNERLGFGAVLSDVIYNEVVEVSNNPAAPEGLPLHFMGTI